MSQIVSNDLKAARTGKAVIRFERQTIKSLIDMADRAGKGQSYIVNAIAGNEGHATGRPQCEGTVRRRQRDLFNAAIGVDVGNRYQVGVCGRENERDVFVGSLRA